MFGPIPQFSLHLQVTSVGVQEVVGGLQADSPVSASQINNVLGGAIKEPRQDLAGVESRGLGEDDGSSSGDVRGGHGGTADGVGSGVAGVPGTLDELARSGDVGARTEVGEGRALVSGAATLLNDGGSNHGDRLIRAGGAEVASIGIAVTGGNSLDDAGISGSIGSVVHGLDVASTEGHVGDGSPAGPPVVHGPLDARNDAGPGAGTTAAQDLDGDDGGVLGKTVLGTSHSAGYVSAVTVAVIVVVVTNSVGSPDSTTLNELVVGNSDTSVDDEDINTSSLVLVAVGIINQVDIPLVNTSQVPDGIILDDALVILNNASNTVGVNVGNLFVGPLPGKHVRRQTSMEAQEFTNHPVGDEGVHLLLGGELEVTLQVVHVSNQVIRGEVTLQDDNIFVGNLLREIAERGKSCNTGGQSKKEYKIHLHRSCCRTWGDW